MIKRIAKGAAIGAAALGLLAGSTPAQAQAGVGVFQGTATVAPNLGYPPVGVPTFGTGACTGAWAFSIAVGVGVKANGTTAALSGNVNGCLNDGILDLGPYCGASGGKNGNGNIAGLGAVSDVGWLQSAASLIVFDGDMDPEGKIWGVVTALPPVDGVAGTGSCASGTASSFTIVGAAVADVS